jgi:signal transduction histidine kinase
MLSGLAFYLEAADSKLKDSLAAGAGEALERSRTLLARIREEFRQCIWCLYELGRQTGELDNELRRLARIQRQWSHAEVNTEIIGEPFPLPASISRGLLLACQEAVENASRHGKAARIEIHCEFSERGVAISVEDDGCGFDVSTATDAPGGHYGLSGMRQRVERLGGVLDVVSKPSTGTRLTMRLSRECIVKVEANPLVLSSLPPHPRS